MGKRLIIAASALCSLSTPSYAAHQQPATEEQKNAATAIYMDCLKQQAARLDDGTSDVLSVGAAIAPGCRGQLDAAAEVMAQGQNKGVHIMLRNKMESHAAEDAAAAVLWVRKQRSSD